MSALFGFPAVDSDFTTLLYRYLNGVVSDVRQSALLCFGLVEDCYMSGVLSDREPKSWRYIRVEIHASCSPIISLRKSKGRNMERLVLDYLHVMKPRLKISWGSNDHTTEQIKDDVHGLISIKNAIWMKRLCCQ
ncbi:hypothetical protein U9M48_010049 [Paspalum notatum var. saurae]|uniref:Uncharacterized protein n=1 Tax=Paspalum notatum var. saurae TaxID=547442 RepID=A0AAQ3SSP9_PASNO